MFHIVEVRLNLNGSLFHQLPWHLDFDFTKITKLRRKLPVEPNPLEWFVESVERKLIKYWRCSTKQCSCGRNERRRRVLTSHLNHSCVSLTRWQEGGTSSPAARCFLLKHSRRIGQHRNNTVPLLYIYIYIYIYSEVVSRCIIASDPCIRALITLFELCAPLSSARLLTQLRHASTHTDANGGRAALRYYNFTSPWNYSPRQRNGRPKERAL